MSSLADVLRTFWLGGVNDISGECTTSFKAWLTEGRYVFSSKEPDGTLIFYAPEDQEIMKALGHDINKMGIASFESIRGIPPSNDIPRSTAWSLIRAYYAAFFAAHAISRFLSRGVYHFDHSQVQRLNQALSIYGEGFKITCGIHVIDFDLPNRLFSIKLLKNGSHEDTWSIFGTLIENISEQILSLPIKHISTPGKQTAVAVLIDLLSILKTPPCHRNHNWLSYTRNQINYQLSHGAWYPHHKSNRFRDKVATYLSSWKRDPEEIINPEDHPIVNFCKGCTLSVSIMKDLMEETVKRNSEDNSFLKHGAFKVLRQC